MANCGKEYVPTQWVNGTAPAINAVNLNHIEKGISDNASCVLEIEDRIDIIEESGGVPLGTIVMFSGSSVPNKWALCNGSNGTPNLIDKFVRAGATAGATGGSNNASTVSHTHTFTGNALPDHTHNVPNIIIVSNGSNLGLDLSGENAAYSSRITQGASSGTPSGTIASSGSDGTNKNIPAYYTLMYIMKIT